MSLFTKRIKAIEVTVFDKARMAVLGVESALSIFNTLKAEITHANSHLSSVITDCEAVVAQHTELKTNAEEAIKEYETLLQNIEKLTGGTKS